MLAVSGSHVPTGDTWWHEVKWDGMRILTDGTRLHSRNENDVTGAWPDVSGQGPDPGRDLLIDGEIIALNDAGRPDFRALADRIHVHRAAAARRLADRQPVTFMAFDLLRLDGRDVTGLPLAERRELLGGVELGSWQLPQVYDDGPLLHAATREQGLEGIVSKRRDSPYRPGQRSPHWLKFAHRLRGSYVVGGWRPQEGTAGGPSERLAALLVGEPTADGLAYRGRVGSGIGPKVGRQLTELLAPYGRGDSPFVDEVPRPDARGTHWVDPVVVVDVDSHGVGYDRLRQPSYQGVRTDLDPGDLDPGPHEEEQ